MTDDNANDAQAHGQSQPGPNPALRNLDGPVGAREKSDPGESGTVDGRTTLGWMEDGYFLLRRVGNESGFGDKMSGGTGADLVNGQGGNDTIKGGPGRDTLKTGKGSNTVEAKDGTKDTIICNGPNNTVYYDKGLDVLEGCPQGLTELPPTGSPFEPGTKVVVDHGGKELCLPEAALKAHLRHGGDEVLSWSGCTEQQ